MIVDTSAVIAVILREPEFVPMLDAASSAQVRLISTVSALECSIVAQRRLGPEGMAIVAEAISQLGAFLIPFDEEQADLAQTAYSRFGKGMGHPAQLNFGDCATYARAAQRKMPILALGTDFAATDFSVVQFSRSD